MALIRSAFKHGVKRINDEIYGLGIILMNVSLKMRISPDGMHLFDRSTGANILFDELKFPCDQWSLASRFVSIALTNRCNLSCLHCYAPKDESFLDFDLLVQWVIELDKNGCMGVGFGGGEPTLYPRFTELCEIIVSKTNLAVSMTTHGYHLTDNLLHNLEHNLHFMRVSIDGIGDTYRHFRKRDFSKLVMNLKRINGRIPFGINTVVNQRTINELDDLAVLAEDLGASELLLLSEVKYGRGKAIDGITIAKMQNWIKSYSGNLRLAVSESYRENIPIFEPFQFESGISAYSHIDANGMLKPNSFTKLGVDIERGLIIDAMSLLKLKYIKGEVNENLE